MKASQQAATNAIDFLVTGTPFDDSRHTAKVETIRAAKKATPKAARQTVQGGSSGG
jgi:hypothetical protein